MVTTSLKNAATEQRIGSGGKYYLCGCELEEESTTTIRKSIMAI
jgi:hypothetical protein